MPLLTIRKLSIVHFLDEQLTTQYLRSQNFWFIIELLLFNYYYYLIIIGYYNYLLFIDIILHLDETAVATAVVMLVTVALETPQDLADEAGR